MKFSEKWLREWIDPALTTDQLVEQLTMAGLEVDSVAHAAGVFSNVVVAEIIAVAPHPDADRLRVCTVNNGTDTLPIVCGGANVRPGLKVPLANIGATLPDGITIKKGKLRGVESFGMICSTKELGLTDTSSGVMELSDSAPMGEDINFYLELDDKIIDVDLTPNRGDCLSIRGLARDLAAITSHPMEVRDENPIVKATITDTFSIIIKNPKDCPRYVGRIIRNINAHAATPAWMVERLRRGGIRAVNPVVDVINYVMLQIGQPMHAFDLHKLNDNIVVRFAKHAEKICLLNEKEVVLDENTLVIADAKNVLAVAGVMGGKDSGVTENTQDIFLESAFFNPVTISGKARKYAAFSESSHRFERGVDPAIQVYAIERLTELLLEIIGGEPGPVIEKLNLQDLPKPIEIFLNHQQIPKYLGLEIAAETVEDILQRLHMQTKKINSGWQVSVPSFRFDIERDVDLIEEIARIYGYAKVPSHYPSKIAKLPASHEMQISRLTFCECLIEHGYHEAITYSFVDPKLQKLMDSSDHMLTLLNPIAPELSVMRTSLWPGLLNAALYNQRRQQSRVRLFEIGHKFIATDDTTTEEQVIAGVVTATAMPELWSHQRSDVDFYDIKGDVEALLQLTNRFDEYMFVAAPHAALHPGQASEILHKDKTVGYLGRLHPKIEKELDIQAPVYLFELQLDTLLQAKLPKFKELSKFPGIRRDIAIVVEKTTTAQQIQETIRQASGNLLTEMNIFDVYTGPGIQNDKKSLALALILQHTDRTLVDNEADEFIQNILSVLKDKLNAEIR